MLIAVSAIFIGNNSIPDANLERRRCAI